MPVFVCLKARRAFGAVAFAQPSLLAGRGAECISWTSAVSPRRVAGFSPPAF